MKLKAVGVGDPSEVLVLQCYRIAEISSAL
jgi:hypothetical protein